MCKKGLKILKSFMRKVALLSMCPVGMVVALLTPTMVYIYQAFATLSEATVTMVLTIPNLTVIIGLISAPILAKKYSMKYLIIIGMSLFTGANVLCAFCESFYLMLFLRALCGIGCGVVLPLQNTFIASYPEDERAVLLGLNTVATAVIIAPLAILSGIIATINWRYVFLLYSVNIIVVILAAIFLPKHIDRPAQNAREDAKETKQPVAKADKPKLKDYSKIICFYLFMLSICYLLISALSAQLAPYLEYTNLGGATESGLLVSVSLVGSLVAGVTFGKMVIVYRRMVMPVAQLCIAVGFVLLCVASNLFYVGVAQAVTAWASCVITMMVNFELSRALPLELFPTVSAGVNFCIFVFQFLAPMLCLLLLDVFGGSFRTVFMNYTIVQIVMFGLAVVLPNVLLKRK